jgi:hypothetical protein
MVSISMSPDQFVEAKKILARDFPAQEKESLVESGEFTGHVHTQYVDADYEYRQLGPADGALVFTNEVKHGMYKFLSDDTIGAHLCKILAELPSQEELDAAKTEAPVEHSDPATGTQNVEPVKE